MIKSVVNGLYVYIVDTRRINDLSNFFFINIFLNLFMRKRQETLIFVSTTTVIQYKLYMRIQIGQQTIQYLILIL